jgi:hypothetical protein
LPELTNKNLSLSIDVNAEATYDENFSHDKGIAQISTGKQASKQDKTELLEHWINKTLSKAQQTEMPGLIVKTELSEPLACFNLDKPTLQQQGFSDAFINSLYKKLFLNTMNFYEFLKSSTAEIDNGWSKCLNRYHYQRVESILRFA